MLFFFFRLEDILKRKNGSSTSWLSSPQFKKIINKFFFLIMPWFWTESIKKKVCRYLLQHYLGHFLQQKLQYDQLSVDLYNGSGCVENVQLDVFAINEVVQKVNAPIEILNGTVQSISVCIPWKTIFNESCIIEVRGIQLTIQPKYVFDTDLANMTDSFCSSFKNMTTSMQVAQECMRDAEKQESDAPMVGLDLFAQAIESIFRRIVLKFGEINLCFEHIVPSSSRGIGLRLSIKYFEYFDEDSDKENELAAQSQGKNAPVIENVAFSCKQFKISGVDIYIYQFLGNKNFIDIQQNYDTPNESSMLNPVLIAQLYGEQQVKLRIKQNDQLSGPKLDGELYLGDIAAFIIPKQLHLLVDFFDGFVSPSSAESNYTPDSFPNSISPPEVPNRSLNGRNKNLNRKFEASHFKFDSESSDFTPVESPTSKPKIVQFHHLTRDDSFSSDTFKSTVEHFKVDEPVVTAIANNQPKRRFSSNGGGDLNYSEIFRLQVKVVALSLAVLHVDPTNIGENLSTTPHNAEVKESSVDSDSYLFNLITNYFTDVRKAFEKYGLIELFQNRALFTNAARKHDHLRILAGPLHVECERKTSSQKTMISSTKVNASIGNAEFFECLYNGKAPNSKQQCDCIELLVFPMPIENSPQSMHFSACSTQCVRLLLEISDTNEQLHTYVRLQLSDCKSEVDISIIDRLSDLLYSFDTTSKGLASTNASGNFAVTPASALCDVDAVLFQKVLDESETKSFKYELHLTSTHMHVAFRFPIPDLRPEIQRRPWFERMLRDEILHLDIKDLDCQTLTATNIEQNRKSIKCRFREMVASYAEKSRAKPTLFLRTCQDKFYQSEVDNDYDWPLVKIEFQKQINRNQLLNSDDSNVQDDDSTLQFLPHHYWETERDSRLLLNSYYEPSDSRKPSPSPFSHRKVFHNGENVILPGDEEEIQRFVDHASDTAKVSIVLNFPVVNIALPSKTFIENLYNRFGNDLLLWEPAAPQPNAPLKPDMHLIPPRLDLESQFFSTREHISDSTQSKSAMHMSFMTDDTSESFMSNNTIPKSFQKCPAQSLLSLSLNINKGTISLCSSVKSENGDSQTGQIFIELANGSLFTVSQYLGNPNLDYVCVQIESCLLYHKLGLASIPVMEEIGCGMNVPSYLNSILYPVNIGVVSAFESRNMTQSSSNQKMVTVVLKLEEEKSRAMKHCLVAALLNGLTLRHQFLPVGQSFLEQLIEIFDLEDTPVLGYKPPTFVTEVHFHVNDCAVDYKPIYLSTRAVATISSFALSSNVTADAERSNLQIVMDNVNIYLSDNCEEKYVDLRQNFVNVLSVALLELCVKLRSRPPPSKSKNHFPDLELIISNSHIRMWTCADSTALLAALLRYIAENGDIVWSIDDDDDERTLSYNGEEESKENGNERSSRNPTSIQPSNQKACFEEHLEDLLADAVIELDHESAENKFKDSNPYSSSAYSNSGMVSAYEEDARSLSDFVMDGDDDFCIIDDFTQSSKDEPKIEYFVENRIVVVDNYFTPVTGRADQLKPPEHFPNAIIRYTVREMSCSWYIYGGNDFQVREGNSRSAKDKESNETYAKLPCEYAKRSPLHVDKKPGGLNRNYKVLMEFHVTKARFHHEMYSAESKYDSRTVLAVANFEVHDRLQSSQINKFLYHFHNESSPKQSNADMLLIKALLIRAEQHKDPECKLRISLQPLRLNIDQDALIFLTDYFAQLASSVTDDANYPIDDGSTYGTAPSTFAEPLLEVNHQKEDSTIESNTFSNESDHSNVVRPLFFNEFIFSPAVPIRLDYHGKHIAIEHGKIAGLLMGLGRLNCSQLKLQKIVHRHGLLGFDKLVNFVLNEWAADIRNNQLPSILGGVGPMHSFVQLFQGVRDLVWLPVEQYRKDGRIVRGLQRGTSSFGTSTSMAMLELSNRMVGFVQSAAETACDIVSPAEVQKSRERYRNTWRGLEKQARRSRQPSDVREGFNNACSLLQHGFTDTAYSIARVAQKEHERKGLTGAVGGVIRHMPVTLVRPLAFTSEAAAHLISGIRNQIEPDARKEDEDKWRDSANGP